MDSYEIVQVIENDGYGDNLLIINEQDYKKYYFYNMQWQSLYNEILINNIVVKNDSNHLYLNGNFGARAETGELFDKTSSNGSKLFFI